MTEGKDGMSGNANGNDLIVSWLHDALAMENALAAVLQHRIKDAQGFPAVEQMDRRHLAETLEHADRVKRCLARFGAKPSTAKSLFGTLFGAMQAPMTGLAKDEVVKNCLVDHAAEQFEVAAYAALIAAANAIGDPETATLCEQNRREDEAMAARIMAALPGVVAAQLGTATPFAAGRATGGELIGQPQAGPVDGAGATAGTE